MKLFTEEFLFELIGKPEANALLNHFEKCEGLKFHESILKVAEALNLEPKFIEKKEEKS